MLDAGPAIGAEGYLAFAASFDADITLSSFEVDRFDLIVDLHVEKILQRLSHRITAGSDHLALVPHRGLAAYSLELPDDRFYAYTRSQGQRRKPGNRF